jgi:hypothetical protein
MVSARLGTFMNRTIIITVAALLAATVAALAQSLDRQGLSPTVVKRDPKGTLNLCADKAEQRIEAGGHVILRQTSTTLFLASRFSELSVACSYSKIGELVPGQFGMACGAPDLTTLFDLAEVPAAKRKRMTADTMSAIRKAKDPLSDPKVSNGYEIVATRSTDSSCGVVLYPTR